MKDKRAFKKFNVKRGSCKNESAEIEGFVALAGVCAAFRNAQRKELFQLAASIKLQYYQGIGSPHARPKKGSPAQLPVDNTS